MTALHPEWRVPSLVRQVKGSKGHLPQPVVAMRATPEPLAGSQEGRPADGQYQQRGREAVVAGGVTPTQGHG
jgi:hypothetical protein